MNAFSIDAIISALKSVARPSGTHFVPLHEPEFAGDEWVFVKECLDTAWVSSVGKYVDRFEQDLAAFTGVRRAVAVVNGTAALHICLKLVGVEAGDEVLVPSLTFVATANAVHMCSATPHFVDSCEETLGLDPDRLGDYLADIAEVSCGLCRNRRTGASIKAVVPMHTFGHSVDMDKLLTVCSRYGIAVIEDAAESLGTYYKGRHTGNFGRVAALSFNGNKIITTGGGGAILTNDEKLATRAKHLTTTAKIAHPWAFFHDEAGFNYRLPNLNAALGCAQMQQLPRFIEQKRLLAERYAAAFTAVEGVRFFTEPGFSHSNYWLNTLLLDPRHADKRDELLEVANGSGLMTRPAWTLMHELPMFAACPRMHLPIAESLSQRIVNLPSSAKLECHHDA